MGLQKWGQKGPGWCGPLRARTWTEQKTAFSRNASHPIQSGFLPTSRIFRLSHICPKFLFFCHVWLVQSHGFDAWPSDALQHPPTTSTRRLPRCAPSMQPRPKNSHARRCTIGLARLSSRSKANRQTDKDRPSHPWRPLIIPIGHGIDPKHWNTGTRQAAAKHSASPCASQSPKPYTYIASQDREGGGPNPCRMLAECLRQSECAILTGVS